MSNDFSRTRRVAEQMQRELAVLIQQEIKDPRIGMVTVSAVDVSRDLSTARIYITVLDEKQDIKLTLDILNKAAGFLRHALGQRVKLRHVPSLGFVFDESISRGNALSSLIDQAIKSDQDHHQD